MSNTFLSKVVAERAALTVINRKYPVTLQLTGLSSPAIEQWQSKVALPAGHVLVQILVRIGEVAQTLSNRSNESFTPLTPEVQVTLDQLMKQLTEHVQAL